MSVIFAMAGLAGAAASGAQTPPSITMPDYRHMTAAQLQKSESPRDWALGSQLLDNTPAGEANLRERARILQRSLRAVPRDPLVQAMWANLPAPARVNRHRQQLVNRSTLLTQLDPLNGVAWVAAIDYAWKSGNSRNIDSGLQHMANALGYNEHFGQAIGAWRDVFRRYPPPPASSMLPRYGTPVAEGMDASEMAFLEASHSVTPPVQSLVEVCSRSKLPHAGAKRFETCGKVGRLMMGRAQTLLGRIYGVAILRASHAGTKADVALVRAVTWQQEQDEKIVAALADNRYAKENYLDLVQRTDSEILAVQYELRMAGIPLTPPDDWKQTLHGKAIEPLDDPVEATD